MSTDPGHPQEIATLHRDRNGRSLDMCGPYNVRTGVRRLHHLDFDVVYIIKGEGESKSDSDSESLDAEYKSRNGIVHWSNHMLKLIIDQGLRQYANNNFRPLADNIGRFRHQDYVISWKASFIPFHTEYTVRRLGVKCQHLASVKNWLTRDLVSRF